MHVRHSSSQFVRTWWDPLPIPIHFLFACILQFFLSVPKEVASSSAGGGAGEQQDLRHG
jgi:hypothetical protein